jgi:hypothetical protein
MKNMIAQKSRPSTLKTVTLRATGLVAMALSSSLMITLIGFSLALIIRLPAG